MIIKREFDFAYVDGVSAEMLGRETGTGARVKKFNSSVYIKTCWNHLDCGKQANNKHTKNPVSIRVFPTS